MGKEKYKLELDNIKTYLEKHGITCKYVLRWQGGFSHTGKQYGCDIITTIQINDKEELQVAIPRWVLTNSEQKPYLIIEPI